MYSAICNKAQIDVKTGGAICSMELQENARYKLRLPRKMIDLYPF